ncbi:MAG: hypothetical protein ACO231_07795 [Prochlorococcaceae cyanobacterium]
MVGVDTESDEPPCLPAVANQYRLGHDLCLVTIGLGMSLLHLQHWLLRELWRQEN